MEKANVYLRDRLVGTLERLDRGYSFTYLPDYLTRKDAEEVALSLPLHEEAYVTERHLPAFFDGLIPEGWMLQLAVRTFGIKVTDRFELLLATAQAPIGAVRVEGSAI